MVERSSIYSIFSSRLQLHEASEGGEYFFFFTMVNNHMGHGFYQFSPELFFRVFCKSNGFEVVEMLLIGHQYPRLEIGTKKRIYRVRDPESVGKKLL